MGMPKQRALIAIGVVFLATLALFIVFRPGDQASAGVDLGDPNAWIEHALDGELLQVNGSTGEIIARIEVAEPGQTFTAVPHGDGAVLFNEDASSISIVSGSLLRVVGTLPVTFDADADPNLAASAQIFGSADARQNVVVLTNEALISLDTQSSTETPIPLPASLASTVQDDLDRVLALPAAADEVLRLGSDGLAPLALLAEPVSDTADQRSLVRAGDSAFVVDPARLSISEVLDDGTFGLPFCTTSAATGAVIGGSGENDEPLIVAYNPVSTTMSVSTPGNGCFDFPVDLPSGDYGQPVVNDEIVYLPNWSDGRIAVIDIDQEQVVANFPFGSRTGRPFELDVIGSLVWANERSGPFAAVLDEGGITAIPKISTIVAGQAQINEEGEGDSLVGADDAQGSGLVVIGDSGDQVVAAPPGESSNTGQGPNTGPETGETDAVDIDNETSDAVEPNAVGIAASALEPAPIETGDGLGVEPTENLVANFGVSSSTVTEGEIIRFTDFSTGSPVAWTWDFGDGSGAQEPNVEKSWDVEGVYLVSLTVTNNVGAQSVQVIEVTVVPETVLIAPTADFAFDRNTIEVGENVTLESRTVGESDLLEWDFGDGDGSIGPSATHTYDSPGEFTVTLTASNPAGQSTATTVITVLSGVEAPTAVIGGVPTSIVNGQFVTFRSESLNEPTRLSWDFGDGTSGAGESAQHQWDRPGTYRVRLTVENSEGSNATFVDVVVAQRIDPPVSQLTQSATEVLVGETVTFTSLSLNNPTRLIWDFADGTTANGQTASKSWTSPGRYRVTLRATNDAGTNRNGVTITVVQPVDAPVASFDASTLIIAPGQRIDFQDTSTNNPTSWAWDFGDTGVSNNPNTSHEWARPGTYTVRLTVSNEGGRTTTAKQVVVRSPPNASFEWQASGRVVSFTDRSSNDPQSWRWDFGDGTTSNERNPTHTFALGVFDVTLVTSNNAGSSAPSTQQISFAVPPVADIACSADGPVLTCSAEGSTNATTYSWSVPDALSNSTPGQPTTTLLFDSAGRFDIVLVVQNEAGDTDRATLRAPRVTVGRSPRVSSVDVIETQEGGLVRLQATFDRGPAQWEWSVEGAELVEGGNTPTPLFRIPENGTYEGRVIASNVWGRDTDPISFTANPFGVVPPPETVASFEWQVIQPGVVQYRNTSQAAADATFEWRFNGSAEILDNNPQAPIVRYPDRGGTWTTVLVAEDENVRNLARQNVTVPAVE